jgi:hypothetical protein
MPGWLRLRGIGYAYFIPLRLRHVYSRPGDIERYPANSLVYQFDAARMNDRNAYSVFRLRTMSRNASAVPCILKADRRVAC